MLTLFLQLYIYIRGCDLQPITHQCPTASREAGPHRATRLLPPQVDFICRKADFIQKAPPFHPRHAFPPSPRETRFRTSVGTGVLDGPKTKGGGAATATSNTAKTDARKILHFAKADRRGRRSLHLVPLRQSLAISSAARQISSKKRGSLSPIHRVAVMICTPLPRCGNEAKGACIG